MAKVITPHRRRVTEIRQVQRRLAVQMVQVTLRQFRQRPLTLRRQRQQIQRLCLFPCLLGCPLGACLLVSLSPPLLVSPRCRSDNEMRIRPAEAKGANTGNQLTGG